MLTTYLHCTDIIILTEIRLLKETNNRQEETIAMLENKERNHEERVIHLEKLQFSKNSFNPNNGAGKFNNNVNREKRPVRLLPLIVFFSRSNLKSYNMKI